MQLSRQSEDPVCVNCRLLPFDYRNITGETGFIKGKRWSIDPFFFNNTSNILRHITVCLSFNLFPLYCLPVDTELFCCIKMTPILNGTHHLLAYADDVNILGGSIHTLKENAEALVAATREMDWK